MRETSPSRKQQVEEEHKETLRHVDPNAVLYLDYHSKRGDDLLSEARLRFCSLNFEDCELYIRPDSRKIQTPL